MVYRQVRALEPVNQSGKVPAMSAATVPVVGDKFEYSVLVSGADWRYRDGITESGRYYLGGTAHSRECDPDGRYSCPMCCDQWGERASTVVSVDHCVDSSVGVRLGDGTRREVVPPSGDACY